MVLKWDSSPWMAFIALSIFFSMSLFSIPTKLSRRISFEPISRTSIRAISEPLMISSAFQCCLRVDFFMEFYRVKEIASHYIDENRLKLNGFFCSRERLLGEGILRTAAVIK